MSDRDYVLGTHDEEVERLGLQHRVWRPWMLRAWQRAGIGPGHTVIDVGAGPGYATVDLTEIAGPEGRVIAFERSRRFLEALNRAVAQREIANVETVEQDVTLGFGEEMADAAWCRWLLSFATDPEAVVANIARALKPGGVAVFHEYGDYGTWQLMPPEPRLETFKRAVVRSWEDAGGEPDVGARLPGLLAGAGLDVVGVRPLIHCVRKSDPMWEWPAAFLATGGERLEALGYIEPGEAARYAVLLDEAAESAWMITPLVLEVIARRPLPA